LIALLPLLAGILIALLLLTGVLSTLDSVDRDFDWLGSDCSDCS
jgi:hypothetical protein